MIADLLGASFKKKPLEFHLKRRELFSISLP